jgi:hypothetical protein
MNVGSVNDQRFDQQRWSLNLALTGFGHIGARTLDHHLPDAKHFLQRCKSTVDRVIVSLCDQPDAERVQPGHVRL